MTTLCIILFLALASLWFFTNEYPALFGIYVSVYAVKRVYFKAIVASALIASAAFSGMSGSYSAILGGCSCFCLDCQAVVVMIMSSLLVLTVLKIFSVTGSVIYAVLGTFAAYLIYSGDGPDYSSVLSFLAAPVMSCLLASGLRWLCRMTLDRCNIHLITLSYYMRIAVVVSLIVTGLAVGINFGGFLSAGINLIAASSLPVWIVIAVFILSVVALSPSMREESDVNAGQFCDFSIYSILSIGFSVALVLIFFSFEESAALMGLRPVPLSVSSLVLSAIAGCEMAQRFRMVPSDEYRRGFAALIITPSGSLLVAYLMFYVTGTNEEVMVDFSVMSAALMLLAALCFIGYARRSRRQREATERLVYVQQQQIYENSRALNDMELKVVLSENQALHNSIEMKKQEVMNVALSIVEQREYLESLNDIVRRLQKTEDDKARDELIGELGVSLKQRLSYDRDVDSQYFYAQAESLHEDFNAKLAENFPDLTQQERRLATLLRLGFSSKYIATLMNITSKSVEISRYRLRQKLGLSKGDNLVNFIKSI